MSLLIFVTLTIGQCSGGSCPTSVSPSYFPQYQPVHYQTQFLPMPSPQAAPETEVRYGWMTVDYKGVRVRVFGKILRNGNILWDPDAEGNAKALREARETKLPTPAPPAPSPVIEQPKPAAENFGLDTRRIGKRVGYSGNVREYGQADSGKVFLTVIGNKMDRQQVVGAWKLGAFDDVRGQVEFGEFESGDWQVKDELGFNAEGSPTILIQHPDGKVAWRAYEYGGMEELRDAVHSALRKPDPHYQPERDPGPHNKPAPFAGIDPGIGLIILTVAAGLILLPRRK